MPFYPINSPPHLEELKIIKEEKAKKAEKAQKAEKARGEDRHENLPQMWDVIYP